MFIVGFKYLCPLAKQNPGKESGMKRIIFFTLICLFAMFSRSYEHPPQYIKLTFDAKTKELEAVIKHFVGNATNHYIKKVDVGLNGKEVIEHQISKQDNPETQTVVYLIPDAKPGDTLSVGAYCSLFGKLEKEIKVKE